MRICVFCSASVVRERFAEEGRVFAGLLASRGHTLVWGGSDKGLMKEVAGSAKAAGGRIVGVTMELLKATARQDADEMHVEVDLVARKAKMLASSDAFVGLVGGTGTLDEVIEILELKTLRVHEKPIVILNTDGFYDDFRNQFGRMEREGLLHRPLSELVFFAETPEQAILYLESHEN